MLPTDEKNREKFAKISAVLISLWQSSRQKLSSATIMPEYTAQCDIFKKNWFKTQNYMFAVFFFKTIKSTPAPSNSTLLYLLFFQFVTNYE